jgi:hypothetical protein
MKAKRKVVCVDWVDAVAGIGWTDDTSEMRLSHCRSVGLVVNETDEALALAGSWATDEGDELPTSNNRIVIPKAWIKRRVVVKL